jgi:diacylglycerol kinase (ATP)
MPRKVKFISNPRADMGEAWRVANDLRLLLANDEAADWSGTVYPAHATELARQACKQGYDLVIALGGDGTVHEVINGLMQVPEKERAALGIVPLGSGNDFAQAFGIPLIAEKALMLALHGKQKYMDVGMISDETGRKEYFNNTLGIGFDAVVTIRSHKITFLRGFLMYLVAVIQTIIMNFDPMKLHVETDSEAWDLSTLMLTACNGPREGGGFLVAPEARNDDGLIDYATICKVSRLMMFRLIPEVMKGTHVRFKQVRMGKFTKMRLTSDRPLYIHTDGEIYTGFGTNIHSLTIETLPAAIRIVSA